MKNTQNILQILKKLVSFKGVSSNTKAINNVANYAAEYLSSDKVTIDTFLSNGFPNLVIRPKKAVANKPIIMLNAHLDVVPADDQLFTFKIEGDKALGRGVYDMQGAAAAIIYLFKALAEEEKIGNNILLTLVTDEEIGGHNGVKFLANEKNVTCDFFIAGEPTNLDICTKQKGILWLEVIKHGKAAHGSRVWNGNNANIALAQNITDFYSKHPIPTREAYVTTYNMSLIQGGTGKNIVSETASAFFDIRRIPEDAPESIIKEFESTFPEATIAVRLNEPPLETNESHIYIQNLKDLIEKHAPYGGNIIHEHFSSDGRFYSEKGISAINFGLNGGGIHQRDEWIDISSIEPYYKILKSFLLQLN